MPRRRVPSDTQCARPFANHELVVLQLAAALRRLFRPRGPRPAGSRIRGAFGRRAVIEQAKGILMARHSINADKAFERLRDHSQRNGRKLSDVAAAVVESHLLLLPPNTAP